MRVVDARPRSAVTMIKNTHEILDGFFLDKDGALWFKDKHGAVLIDARGNKNKMLRVNVSDATATWSNPQSVHGVIRIERNAA